MSVVNVSSRKFRVTVSGLDVSGLVEHFEVGDDRVSSSGLISTRGSIKLRYNAKWNEGRSPKISFDPKIPGSATYWARGQAVKLWIDDTTLTERKHPRHSLRILRATYDRIELSITLEVGCLLALLDGAQPDGDESNTCVNEQRSVDAVIADVLRGAGADYPAITVSYIGFIPGFITSPQEKTGGGSYVALAGELAYSRGYVLWVTKDEEIKAIRIIAGDSVARVVLDVNRDLFEYSRQDETESSEAPYNKIRVRYTLTTITETDQEYTSYSQSYGATPSGKSGLVATTRITDKMEGNRRLIHTITQQPMANLWGWWYTDEEIENGSGDRVAIDQEIFETYTYEDAGGWEDEEADEACLDEGQEAKGKQGRLLEYKKQVLEQAPKSISEWASMHETKGSQIIPSPGRKILIGGWVEASKEITTYTFFDTTDNALEDIDEKDKVKKQTTKKWINEAYIFPKAWAYRDGIGGATPLNSVDAGTDEITWKRRLGSSEWEKKTTREEPIGVANKSIAEARLKRALEDDYSEVLGGARNLAGDLLVASEDQQNSRRGYAIANVRSYVKRITAVETKIEVSTTQTVPPAPEYIPERYSREEEEVVEEIYIASPYATTGQGRTKEVTLDRTVERRLTNDELLAAINPITESGSGIKGAGNAAAQAVEVARVESLLTWGRFRAIDCTYDLRDFWFDLPQLPLTRFDVIDHDRITDQTYRHSYIADGWSNAVTIRDCLCSHDGLWLGTSLGIGTRTTRVTAPVLNGATVIEVDPIGHTLSEGDGVVLEELTSVSVREARVGDRTVGLNAPTTVAIPAGTRMLVGGEVVEVATTVTVGSSSLTLTQGLSVPLATGNTGSLGTIAIVSGVVTVGSTAIPIQPISLPATITPTVVIANTQNILLTTAVPITVEIDLVLTAEVRVFETIEPIVSEVTIILESPAGNTENIGQVLVESTTVIDVDLIVIPTIVIDTTTVIEAEVDRSAESEATTTIEAEVGASINVEVESITLVTTEVEVEVVLAPEATTVLITEVEVIEAITSTTLIEAEVSVASNLGSFELIAIW